jgi:hypothetical protein
LTGLRTINFSPRGLQGRLQQRGTVMCQYCVIDQVKERMLDRRSLFRGAATAAVTATVGSIAAPARAQTPTVAVSTSGVRDLTHELHPDFPTYFGDPQLKMVSKFTYKDHKFNLNEWVINEHTGTHMDAPLHFSPDGKSVAEVAAPRRSSRRER